MPSSSQQTTSPSIRQDRLEVVHGLDNQREARRPAVAPAGDQPNAHRVTPSHEPVAIVLVLMNPV
jgi:hypothetical protein